VGCWPLMICAPLDAVGEMSAVAAAASYRAAG
jgi:hypothetical protein